MLRGPLGFACRHTYQNAVRMRHVSEVRGSPMHARVRFTSVFSSWWASRGDFRVRLGSTDMSLDLAVAVLALVAVDKSGLAAATRTRAQDLRGSSALAHETDVVLILNN